MFRGIGPVELLIILAVVVVLFGASRIGEIGGAVGRTIREFRRELKGPEEEQKSEAPLAEDDTSKTEVASGKGPFQH